MHTSGPHTDDAKALNTGVAAHIAAASPGGARYDASMSPEDRKSATNGIWLCQTCGKLVDNDAIRYTTVRLREWKKRAEETALAEIENRTSNPFVLADSIQVVFDEWDIWRNRSNLPGDDFIFISQWARNAVRYSFTVRIRNRSQHEERLHKLRMQTRNNHTVLFDDWHSIQFELELPSHKWISRQIDHGFNPEEFERFEKADSIWFVAGIVGTREEIAVKLADLDHAHPLRVA